MPSSPQLTRRNLLKASAGLAIAAATPRVWSDPLHLAPGIQVYTVGMDMQRDTESTLEQIATMGYKYVEGFPAETKLTAAELRKLLDNKGLQMVSLHVPFGSKIPAQQFEQAHTLGVRFIVSSTLLPDAFAERHEPVQSLRESMTADDYHQLADKANRSARLVKDAGLQYAYHNHYWEFRDLGDGVTGYDILLKNTDPELVVFEIDCGWMILAGHDPVKYMRSQPGRFRLLHIKDFVKGSLYSGGADRPVGTELGRGRIDYRPIFQEAAKLKIDYYFVEQEPPFVEGLSALQAAAIDYKYLHTL